MCRTTHWMAWVLFGLAVATSNACGGDDKGGASAGSGSATSGAGGAAARGGGSGGRDAGSSSEASGGRSGGGAVVGGVGAGGASGAAGREDDIDAGMEAGGRGGSGGAAAQGGSGGASGSAGSAAGSGGTSGSIGTFETAGSGGMSESGGAGGASGSGGAAESGGAGGASGSGETDQAVMQCVLDAEAAGQTITDCERCLCLTDNCQDEMNAIKDDANANALATCGKENACAGQCCLCSTDGQGDTCGIANYATGVCADEVETAAGATPGAGLVNVGAVMMNCANDGPADNACARITRLETCAAAKCASECPRVVVACP